MAARKEPIVLLVAVVAALGVSRIHAYDPPTWWMEVSWVLAGVPLLVATFRRFPLTPLLYRLIALHALILIVGGHYTYARVPLGDWMKAWFGFTRNNYDRIGHLVQGFVPAILAREILIRTSPLGEAWKASGRASRWLPVLVVAICLAFSAFFEFIEWWAALIGGEAATNFLATQGDIWDTQWDMFCAFSGAILAQLLLSRIHDRQLRGRQLRGTGVFSTASTGTVPEVGRVGAARRPPAPNA